MYSHETEIPFYGGMSMRKSRKSMALRAMVFLFILIGILVSGACGSDTYEAVDTVQSGDGESGKEEKDSPDSKSLEPVSGNQTEEASENTILVYVCGAVEVPGVYELPEHARVYEAIQAAGGLRADADSVHTNQAKVLSDGEQITILTKEEAKAAPADNTAGENAGGDNAAQGAVVNINTAGVSELTSLSGIGESRASDIISYREEHGPFEKVEDIMKVPGIKNALFSKIKDHICV